MTLLLYDLWLSIEQYGDTTRNWYNHRRYEASLARRVEGFTEELPSSKDDNDDNDNDTDVPSPSSSPSSLLRILQFQPAWEEQLLLRLAALPHTVWNSSYAVTEAVGPLPALQDLSRAAMMGRSSTISSTSSNTSNKSPIIEYLERYHGLVLDHQHDDIPIYLSLVQKELEPCRITLLCQDEEWNSVYKQRCIQAGGGRLSQWQARSYRRFLKYQQSYTDRHMTTTTAVERVRHVYALFEHKRSSSLSSSNSRWILGTTQPTRLDVALWDHLMHALTDVHLVIVLAEFPLLLTFVQKVWDDYFANPTEEWQIANALQNATNPFAQVPSLLWSPQREEKEFFRHAVELMEQLSVQDRNLIETVRVAKEARLLQTKVDPNEAFRTWHRWRKGGPYYPTTNNNNNAQGSDEKVRREYHRSDEAWIASMALSTIMAMCVFGVIGGSREK
ncbi:hypothetical protein FisN_9Lh272 [Fistulifera solaris]|uniref:Uncharacterized protein n=1 Tax=Fistulifera solaris TaxID=1519565 RepID=A0A1Z5KM05_FISSO|nr:hypothetical protein FisN_9Lh272 [Fistulifera solaris]|eukprot:GAX26968.1 hypothetical protein FisN_9Lh272 [Fistulifera solaris]